MFRPFGSKFVVQREQENGISSGGIIIPDCAKEKPVLGEIVAVGRDCEFELGMTVIFPEIAGTKINLPDVGDVLLMEEDDILGIVVDQ